MLKFQDETVSTIIKEAMDVVRKAGKDKYQFESFFLTSLTVLLNKAEAIDHFCGFNAEHSGLRLLEHLKNFARTGDNYQSLLVILYRFMVEIDFCFPDDDELVTVALSQIRFASEAELSFFSPPSRSVIRYAELVMPVQILKSLKNSPSIKSVEQFNDYVAGIPKSHELMKSELDSRIETVNGLQGEVAELKKVLQNYRDAFNFVGLYDGFNKLAETKRWEVVRGVCMLFFLAVAMLSPAVWKIYASISSGDYLKDSFVINLPFWLSVAAVELLLIYFYRVVLHNLKSVRGQLVQIDLRRTLCQFVQSYAEYAVKMKAADKEVLSKFENLIFSGIVADAGDIPSTFDGMDQLIKLIQKTKGP
ncbi:hypothetical protein [Pseudomonas sp. zfem005]|uniref:hypothetical protein n=1 Tax=Pseudomonas sp. zfem005 TaxID=3078200 RepID=UPI0029298FFC|nr:hypothetical protein [Pseudomonas sp. zfem005]MDU9415184.1 hypothetical protein [Pseudomonas sp. zfem005]